MSSFIKLCLMVAIPLLTCLNIQSFAQKDLNKALPFGFHFKSPHQNYTKVPFESHSNLIVVKLTIDKSDTLRFILDTGVSSTIIADTKIAKKMGLQYARSIKIAGAGEGEALNAGVSLYHTIQIGDILAYNQNIVVLQDDNLNISEFLGVKIDGIFGHDLFSSFVVTIDWQDKALHLYNPSKFKYKKSKGAKFPIIITHSKPYTDAFAMVSNDKKIPMRLVIDTGAGHALLLNQNKTVHVPDKVIRTNLGRGLNGDIHGMMGRIGDVELGSYQLKNILATFPDSISFSIKFPPDNLNRQGSIGCEILRRFRVTFNYQEGYMLLKPNKAILKEGFEHDMSGMEIKAKGDKFNEYVVDKVIDNSPAFTAGMKTGDELIFINHQHVKELSISEIYKLLSQKEGKEIEVFFRRNGELKFAYFNLKRII